MSDCSSTSTSTTTPTLSSITVTPNPPDNLAVGSTQQFTATGFYSDGSNADITSQVTWASSNTNIATISATGLATGIAAGDTSITAVLSGVTSPPVILTVTSGSWGVPLSRWQWFNQVKSLRFEAIEFFKDYHPRVVQEILGHSGYSATSICIIR